MKTHIAALRKRAGLTQAELAGRVGITRPYLSQLETGERNLSIRLQKRLADAMGCEAAEIVDFSDGASDEDAILEAFRSLSPEHRALAAHLARKITQ